MLHSEGTRIRLNTLLMGFDGFVEVMKRKVDPGLYGPAPERCAASLERMGRV